MNTRRIQCDCKVCCGRAAEVPAKMLGFSTKTLVHNLVCIAYGPASIAGGVIRRAD